MSDLRMPDLNQVTVAGRLTFDPDLKYIQSGRAVCQFSIANTRHYKSKDGERKEDTTFVNVTCWDKTAEWIGKALKKGRPVIVEGRLKTEAWDDKTTGQKRNKTYVLAARVIPLDWDGGGRHSGKSESSQRTEEPIPEDDIPF